MSFKLLNTDETISEIFRLIDDAKKLVVLVSPYFSMESDSRLVRRLIEARRRNVKVTLIIRGGNNDSVTWKTIEELMEAGVEVLAVTYLHAKLYWSDAGAVVTSLNLLKASMLNSVEAGMLAEDEQSRREVFDFIEKYVQPRVSLKQTPQALATSDRKVAGGSKGSAIAVKTPTRASKAKSTFVAKKKREKQGACIRCSDEIGLNPERPYCGACYSIWAEYENPDYVEKFCHQCGGDADTTIDRPLCRRCYRAA